jgi:hypothetical protein
MARHRDHRDVRCYRGLLMAPRPFPRSGRGGTRHRCSQAADINAGIGTSAKPLHAGKAATAGVLPARLVAEGATGPADGLERYAATTSSTFHPKRVVETLGDTPESDR